MAGKKKAKIATGTIALNKRARFDYELHDKFEAGLVLAGWEVKSIRDGKIQLNDTYIQLKNGEAYLVACNITPLKTASTHYVTEPMRARMIMGALAPRAAARVPPLAAMRAASAM